MHALFNTLIAISLLAVVLVLFAGIFALFRGGQFGRNWSNKLMQLRVMVQFIAIVLILFASWWLKGHRN
jgi:hydrogenase/urease accessory protein HupE